MATGKSIVGAETVSGQRNIRLLLADVDGMLVTQDKVLTAAAKAAAREFARHGHLPDSRRESPMLRLNPAIAMVRPKRTSHPAAALPRR
jgi:hypothetical protein